MNFQVCRTELFIEGIFIPLFWIGNWILEVFLSLQMDTIRHLDEQWDVLKQLIQAAAVKHLARVSALAAVVVAAHQGNGQNLKIKNEFEYNFNWTRYTI